MTVCNNEGYIQGASENRNRFVSGKRDDLFVGSATSPSETLSQPKNISWLGDLKNRPFFQFSAKNLAQQLKNESCSLFI